MDIMETECTELIDDCECLHGAKTCDAHDPMSRAVVRSLRMHLEARKTMRIIIALNVMIMLSIWINSPALVENIMKLYSIIATF